MKLHKLLQSNTIIVLLMVIMVPIAGEFKFFPLNDQFRVSFGPTIFFFLLLFLDQKRILIAGIMTSAAIVFFRLSLDCLQLDTYAFIDSFYARLPACFYYFTYALFFYLLRVKKFQHQVLMIGLFGICLELISQVAELTVQYYIVGAKIVGGSIFQISIIAIFRSFFVVSFYSMFVIYEAKIREEEIKRKNDHLLLLLSNLYEESIHVKKTLKNVEVITKESYELYRSLKNRMLSDQETKKLSYTALKIAGDIHDIKKDNQRIYAGISKLITSEKFSEYMHLKDLLHIIIKSNDKYADSLDKHINFSLKLDVSDDLYEAYFLLSILNNLVANSIEAIEHTGEITIYAYEEKEWLHLEVMDTGMGIEDKYNEMIYKPGFSLKFNGEGISSTGIGLSYSKEMIAGYGGKIAHAVIPNEGTKFMIELPKECLIKE
ncbi:ATP-binding protein [Niallia sp. NCCP-28]|uniref:ATP-binding protein n=1 Tax=Niallia sp. NCCP-28 TaxID=2934712 RepID=UPI002084CBEA|nr:sensor histidine kinase [Niallia sp. NCCP-28]GKU82769.1 sensor histidine kinase [Niallia sp. NCCP-28]